MANNATNLLFPALVEFKARQLDTAYARATAICAGGESCGDCIFPLVSSCVAVAKAWAQQAAGGLEQRCTGWRVTDVGQRRIDG